MHFAPPPDEYTLERRALRRMFDRASATYSEAAIVQAEIRTRLLERLDLVKLQPKRVLDLGAASGASSKALKDRYPKAHVVALDLSSKMLARAARQQSLFRRFDRLVGDAQHLPIRDSSIDLVFSNLMLAWCNDIDAVFRHTARVLQTDGLFMFTTLGPDTLKEVREAFREVDEYTHVHRFIDMHDLGDALMRTGFAEPVMDTERLTITYPTPSALMTELRRSGGSNVSAGRRPGLLSRGALRTVEYALESRRRDGVVPVTVEVVYGHAWKGASRPAHGSRDEVVVPLTDLRRSNRKI